MMTGGALRPRSAEHGRPVPEAQTMKALLVRKARSFDALIKDGLVIYPGVDAFIRKAGARYSLALASGARRLEVEFVLKKAKIRDAFSAVVSADEVKNGKPQPESFERALALLNQVRLEGTPEIRASETLVIEDSPRCIRTAKALGMKTVGMATSYKPEDLKDADQIVEYAGRARTGSLGETIWLAATSFCRPPWPRRSIVPGRKRRRSPTVPR